MAENLLIVESSGKIKKLQLILGADWRIMPTIGHIRTLTNDGENNLGFELKADRINCYFKPKNSQAKRIIQELQKAAKVTTRVYIATDPDREGEMIAWHIFEILDHPNIVRVSFSEITEQAVKNALTLPRQLDLNLVESGFARSCLDKLIEKKCSPLVRNIGVKSLDLVSSTVLHLICDRQKEIKNFKLVSYFSVFTRYNDKFLAYFSHDEDNVQSSIPDEQTQIQESNRIYSQQEAEELVKIARANTHTISRIERVIVFKKPPPPFITSSLQQAAGAKLNFSPDKTMKLAQSLYEKGFITYIQTDSVALSADFCLEAKIWLQQNDPHNLPDKVSKFKINNDAQKTIEAIRPCNLFYPDNKLKQEVSKEEFQLYLLIWQRAIASQCATALICRTNVFIKSAQIIWQAKGQKVKYKGYAKYWNDLSVDTPLPNLEEGQVLSLNQADKEQKQTSPPSPYNEPQLVALMETKGIGRPGTYSSSIKTIKTRKYVELYHKKLTPTKLGIALDFVLSKILADFIDAESGARIESSLDAIALGKKSWQPYLCELNKTYLLPPKEPKLIIAQEHKAKTTPTVNQTDYTCSPCKREL